MRGGRITLCWVGKYGPTLELDFFAVVEGRSGVLVGAVRLDGWKEDTFDVGVACFVKKEEILCCPALGLRVFSCSLILLPEVLSWVRDAGETRRLRETGVSVIVVGVDTVLD